jgi:cation:H+ antiporter
MKPSALAEGILERDLPAVFIITIVPFMMAYGFRGEGRINRLKGGLLLSAFIAYEALLFYAVRSGSTRVFID